MPAPKELLELIEHYETNRANFRKNTYNETQTRIELIDPLFKLVGWDMSNRQGYSDEYKEVIHEDRVRVEGKSKAPDYAFRIGGIRKFQLEAKKPSINIGTDSSSAFQIRRYAWSASLSLCVLTNFESLAIYDAAAKPAKTDSARKARAKFYNYTDYAEKWDEICDLLSPDGIQKGNFGKFAASASTRRGSTTIDNQFLEEIEEWRRSLAVDIAANNRGLDLRSLNHAVQVLIDRIIFLRIAEDRGIEKYGRLKTATSKTKIYNNLLDAFFDADRRYNSGLFHLIQQSPTDTDVDSISQTLKVSDAVLKPIINGLYYPDSPYEFSEMPADVLGQVYERFLGKVITLKSGVAEIELKPEVKKSGGVYYTPTYVVRYLVEATIGADLSASQVSDISGKAKRVATPYRVVDPACGSGSFLIEAYQKLLDWYLVQYVAAEKTYSKGKDATIYKAAGGWKLRIAERKRILLDHVYGVDIDSQAVEVTKLSLLLKVLEGENSDEIARQMDLFKDRVLPDLGNNIQCGNSLIGEEYKALYPADMLDPELSYTVNTFDWRHRFPDVFQSGGGFDAVIGNPPYFSIDKTWGAGDHKTNALKVLYPNIHTDKTDIYYYFLAKSVEITQGSVGFIVSRAFLEAMKAEKVRSYISANSGIVEVFDFQNFQVFEGVGIATAMVILSKRQRPRRTRVVKVQSNIDISDRTETFLAKSKKLPRFTVSRTSLSSKPWRLSDSDISSVYDKIDKAGQPLSRICKVGQGMQTGSNQIFAQGQTEIDAMGALPNQVRRRVRNTDIQRFQIIERDEFMLYLEDVTNFDSLPAGVKKYLRSNKSDLEKRAAFKRGNCDWWRYTWPLQKELYKGPRIICPYLATENRFAIDQDFDFIGLTDTTVIFPTNQNEDLRYICAIMNSRLLNIRFKGIGKLKGNGILEYFDNAVSQIPIRRISPKNAADVKIHDRIVTLYDSLSKNIFKLTKPIAATMARDIRNIISKNEAEINILVCELYGFTIEELETAESFFT